MSLSPDTEDAEASAQAASEEIRNQLRWRINACTHPSRLINQIAIADLRCTESTQALAHLIGRSPKVLSVIRAELRKAFEIDPDCLLFTEPKPPAAPQRVDTLTDRALLLLVRASVEINLNHFTALSVRGEPGRRLPYSPLEASQRIIALRLLERLAHAHTAYWHTLAQGSWLTRRERWVELHTQLFADRAFMARQLDELSSAAMIMVQALIDAPTADARQCAGEEWASVQVGELMWPGSSAVAIPGALHLYRKDDPGDVPQVIYLPGVVRNFYEYPTFAALQCGLLELGRVRFHDLWQCLPLDRRNALCRPDDLSQASSFTRGQTVTRDALAHSADALLSGQWSNELACAMKVNHAHVYSRERPRPEPLRAVPFLAYVEGARQQLVGGARLGLIRDHLLKWDHQRRRAEIVLASMTPGLALLTLEHQVKRYEKGLAALLDADEPSVLTPAYREILSLISQLEVHAQALKTLMNVAPQELFNLDFWAERAGGSGTPRRVSSFLTAQAEALRCEVQLQHRLKLLSTAHRDLMIEVIEQPLASRRPGSETRVLSIAVGSEPDAFYPLHNVWVVTTAAALRVPTRQRPVVLYIFGLDGGVLAFSGVQTLIQGIKASLGSRDDSVLWGCVERDKRRDLRAHAARETLGVRYVDIEGKPALVTLRKLLGTYHRLHQCPEDITRIFSEVRGAEVSRALLMAELENKLNVPVNSALSQAQANIDLLCKFASEAKKLPAWLASATRAERKKFRRSQRRYLSSAFAFVNRLEQRLPDLGTFARRALIARLSQDGMTPLPDVDQPLIEMPDDVSGSFCVGSECSVGDRKQILTPTQERTTFSLLQLALHNLDPQAPWTQWRLNRARYLQPDLKQRLNAAYLIPMVSSLDIGGRYDTLINTFFYPPASSKHLPGDVRIPELLNRTLKEGFKHHLFCAIREGLTAQAQSIFSTAMAARTAQDLLKNQHHLQLHVVHLVGHTMQHDRYIAGLVVVQDKRSERCVVYWPKAPDVRVLKEYGSLEQAHKALNQIGALTQNAKALARQIAPGWAFEAMAYAPNKVAELNRLVTIFDVLAGSAMVKGVWLGVEFIRSFSIKHLEPTVLLGELEKIVLEQIASAPSDWLAIVVTPHSNARALLYRASVFDLQRRTQEASRSGKELEKYRNRRLGEQEETRIRRVVAFFSQFFFPILGLFIDVYEVLLLARQYHRYGRTRDALDLGFMSAFLAIDLLLNFLPGPGKIGKRLARIARPVTQAALGRIHRLRMAAQGRPPRLVPPAVNQLKALEHFKIKGVPEGAVALRGPGEQGIYVKNGERFVADETHIYPVYKRSNEQPFRLKNRQAPGQDELILDIHQSREWLLGADAPQPIAGTSTRVLDPFSTPVTPSDWWPPLLRTDTQNRILQSSSITNDWLSWRMQHPMTLPSSSLAPEVFQFSPGAHGVPYLALRVAPPGVGPGDPLSGYYRLLPPGNHAPLNHIVFITRDMPRAPFADVEIIRWTDTARGTQPLPASRHSGINDWVVHAPLFDRPLTDYVGEAFPGMTEKSRASTVTRMIELSGPVGPATATHLLSIRATIDDWLPPYPAKAGQTDDLLRMLRLNERLTANIYIGYDGRTGFTRVDFKAPAMDPSLWLSGREVKAARETAQRGAVEQVLKSQGFDVHKVNVSRGGLTKFDLVAIHPLANSNVYYVVLQWVRTASFALDEKLTDAWILSTLRRSTGSPPSEEVRSAMREQRLIRIVAGIQWPASGADGPSVYFVKVSPTWP
ncbi:hypothetical protein BFW87_01990 [Pseudomonas fluorescens]|uniref:Dermonecrotic toxin N-terminal domain-containing protein n=1 Tax=Pseudomonas fluorescens TaxID=294 RepID=A0A1T2Z6C9_PSEFL|nr:DUF6543 domain-containing protein [Pseudomonas fluorescens]OPB00203.1 hypothetical protein BFW87_01990 [Pseudomonas fluorescens]